MKIKGLLLIVISILATFLCSCGLVEYKNYDAPVNEELLLEIDLLEEQIDAYLNIEEYFEQDYLELKVLVQDAKNELNECLTIEKAREVFSQHEQIIKQVPTAKSITLDRLNGYIVFENYRPAEQTALTNLLNEYLSVVNEQQSVYELELLFSVFKTKVSEFKTDQTYYKQELSALIENLKQEFLSIDYSLYRTAERLLIEQLYEKYTVDMATISTKEDANAYHQDCMQIISTLKTDQELSNANKQDTINSWKDYFDAFADEFDITNTDQIDSVLLGQADFSVREINKNCALLLISLSEEIGNSALEHIKYGIAVYANNFASISDYRKEEQESLTELIENINLGLLSTETVGETTSLLETFIDSASALYTNEQLWEKEDQEFFNNLTALYGDGVLQAPSSLTQANDYTELASIIDYYAFYQLDFTTFLRNTFRVKLNFPVKSAQWEINEVYWYSELLRSAVGITGYFEENTTNLVVTLVPYALATNSNADGPQQVKRYENLVTVGGSSSLTDRNKDFNDFPYLSSYTKTLNGVWNSQQLWYALEHEYIPQVVSGSNAEKVLNRAKEILRDIIKDGMSDEQKVYAIFNYLASNVTYDFNYWRYIHPDNRELFPDEESATLMSFNAEGVFLENFAVCCGYTKAYLIMLRIEDIESYRITLHRFTENALIDHNNPDGYGSHALVAIKLSDGKFYYSDADESFFHNNEEFVKLHQFAITEDYDSVYPTGYTKLFLDLEYGNDLPSLLTEGLSYKNTSVYIKNSDQVHTIIDEFKKETKKGIQLSIFDNGLDFSIEDILDKQSIKYHSFSFGGLKEYILYK